MAKTIDEICQEIEVYFHQPYKPQKTAFNKFIEQKLEKEASDNNVLFYRNCEVDETWSKEALINLAKLIFSRINSSACCGFVMALIG